MRHETKLLQLVTKHAGIVPSTSRSTASFLNNKISKLCAEHPAIRKFLTQQTSYLPKYESAANRWRYYKAGKLKPHLCPTCAGYIPVFDHKYCCHRCSTLAPTAERGPKVDLKAKETAFRKELKHVDPSYTLLEYGLKRSKFRHLCGNEFWLGNRALLKDTGSCTCLHKKITAHTLGTLAEWHVKQQTGFTPKKLLGAQARLSCNTCHHVFTTRKFYDRRCPNCFPNIFASNIVTTQDYITWLAKNRKTLTLVGDYVNVRTAARYLHHTCGQEFTAKPGSVTRRSFRCPACAPKTCGSLRIFTKFGRELKLRGKEHIALSWILKNTTIKLRDISVDLDGTVPHIRYQGLTRTQEYRPDFYVKARNLIIEVKDGRTLGLGKVFFYVSGEQLWKTNCAKAKACLVQGYKFQMLLFDRNNRRISLPNGWYDLTHKQILNWAKSHGTF